jgi:hypothetical protein
MIATQLARASAAAPLITEAAAVQMVLLPAPGMDLSAIAKVAFTSEDRVRDVIRNFNADGFGSLSLYPEYKGGRPPKFTCRIPGGSVAAL